LFDSLRFFSILWVQAAETIGQKDSLSSDGCHV
jgi:hypothetical protein